MPTSFVLYPLGEKLTIGQLPAVGDFGGGLGLAGIKGEEGGYGGDHVCHGKTVGAGRHDVGAVKLYGGERDAAVLLADAGLDERAEEGLDGATSRAPRRRPQRQERDAGGRGDGEIGLKGIIVANSAGGCDTRSDEEKTMASDICARGGGTAQEENEKRQWGKRKICKRHVRRKNLVLGVARGSGGKGSGVESVVMVMGVRGCARGAVPGLAQSQTTTRCVDGGGGGRTGSTGRRSGIVGSRLDGVGVHGATTRDAGGVPEAGGEDGSGHDYFRLVDETNYQAKDRAGLGWAGRSAMFENEGKGWMAVWATRKCRGGTMEN